MARTSRFRACPLCEAICGLELQYEDEQLTAIRGDEADPFSRGHICPKGNAILDLERDPDRLRQPMRRVGNDWQAIGWDEAFALAGARLAEIQLEHGASAVAAYLGNPNVHHFGHIAYLPQLLRALSTRPAEILKLPQGRLAVGAPADLIRFDPDEPFVVDPETLHSKCRNTPFDEARMQGRVKMTLVAGAVAYE